MLSLTASWSSESSLLYLNPQIHGRLLQSSASTLLESPWRALKHFQWKFSCKSLSYEMSIYTDVWKHYKKVKQTSEKYCRPQCFYLKYIFIWLLHNNFFEYGLCRQKSKSWTKSLSFYLYLFIYLFIFSYLVSYIKAYLGIQWVTNGIAHIVTADMYMPR